MAGVIRTHLDQTGESITLGGLRSAAPSVAPASVHHKVVVEPMRMAAVAIGAVAPAATPLDDADEREAARLAETRQRARDEGVKQGQAEGRAAVESEWQDRLQRLVNLTESLHGEREAVLGAIEDDVVALTFEAVTRILGDLPVTKLIVQRTVRALFASGDYRDPITVRVSSEDYELLVAEPAIVELEDQRSALRLVEDARIKLGGCIVETARGALDARIETQVERLRLALLEGRASKSAAA